MFRTHLKFQGRIPIIDQVEAIDKVMHATIEPNFLSFARDMIVTHNSPICGQRQVSQQRY